MLVVFILLIIAGYAFFVLMMSKACDTSALDDQYEEIVRYVQRVLPISDLDRMRLKKLHDRGVWIVDYEVEA